MEISAQRNGGELTISLSGELDHHAARRAIPEVLKLVDFELPVEVVLDFNNITFMDSSGIALIIGVFKRARSVGGKFRVINASKQVYRVLEAASICKIVDVSQKGSACTQKIGIEG